MVLLRSFCLIALFLLVDGLNQGQNVSTIIGFLRSNHRVLSEIRNHINSEERSLLDTVESLKGIMALEEKVDAILTNTKADTDARPRDCADIQSLGHSTSGVYTIYPEYQSSRLLKRVYCDLTTDGGRWLVFQKRQDGSVDFNRKWEDYNRGFGSAETEYWLGNKYLHLLTSQREYELRIDLWDFENQTRYATHDLFTMGSEEEKFLTHFGQYAGNAGKAFGSFSDVPFSTPDRDHDASSSNCAGEYRGGWWYGACHSGCLNCLYLRGEHKSVANGVNWHGWRGFHYSLRQAEMKIRPVSA